MRTRILRLFAFAFSVILLSGLQVSTKAQTADLDKGITVSPIKFEFSASPGETVIGELKYYNATFSTKTIYLYSANFRSDNTSGTPLFYTENVPFSASLKDWIRLDRDVFNVQRIEPDNPNIERIKFIIDVPEDAEPGGHYAGIISTIEDPAAALEEGASNLTFKSEQAAIILLNVEGDVDRSLQLDRFYATDPFKKDVKKKTLFEWMPINFLTELTNLGNSHTVPLGTIQIFRGEVKIDEIPFNEAQGFILRESSRQYNSPWEGSFIYRTPKLNDTGEPIKDDNGNILTELAVNWDNLSKFRFGRYTAKLVAAYDDGGQKQSIIGETSFWVIPWKLILLIIMIIFGYFLAKKKAKQIKNKLSKRKHDKKHNSSANSS